MKKNIPYKYYKGEKTNPFSEKENGFMWWEGENQFAANIKRDSSFYSRVLSLYNEALSEDNVSGILADKSIQTEKRVLIFYLDLWHGKNYPYDNLDEIFSY